jgi:hypothetical protein
VNTIPNTRTTLCGPVSGVARATGTRHPSKSIIDHHTRPLRRTGGSSLARLEPGFEFHHSQWWTRCQGVSFRPPIRGQFLRAVDSFLVYRRP